MEEKNLICINCPLGCMLTVKMEKDRILGVSGNTCKRGEAYAQKELTNPTRIVTSTVKVSGGRERFRPGYTYTASPKQYRPGSSAQRSAPRAGPAYSTAFSEYREKEPVYCARFGRGWTCRKCPRTGTPGTNLCPGAFAGCKSQLKLFP